jgi:hypothetical protein
VLVLVALIWSAHAVVDAGEKAAPIYRSLPATKAPTARDIVSLPDYRDGQAVVLRVGGRFAYLIKPKGRVDPSKRWVWIFPFEHALASAGGDVEHQYYVDAGLAKGFHVAGIDVGVACGVRKRPSFVSSFMRFWSAPTGSMLALGSWLKATAV